MKLNEYMINESVEFSKLEDNPMIYTIILSKLANTLDTESIKHDAVIKNAVDITEKFIKTLPLKTIKLLKESFKPYSTSEMFKLSNNSKNVFDDYFKQFMEIICNNESNFIKCMNLNEQMAKLYNSPEYQIYRNTL